MGIAEIASAGLKGFTKVKERVVVKSPDETVFLEKCGDIGWVEVGKDGSVVVSAIQLEKFRQRDGMDGIGVEETPEGKYRLTAPSQDEKLDRK
jgi:hypothetical protein